MKRVFRTMCLIAMVALVATSCKKKDETASFNMTMGQFTMDMDDEDAKAYFDINDNLKMKWSEGDELMVYNLNYSDYTKSEVARFGIVEGAGTTNAHFAGSAVGEKQDAYFYFYHADKASGELMSGNRETFHVDAVQTYSGPETVIDPKSLVAACQVNSISNENFTLKHIFGVLNVKLKGNVAGKNVESIVLADNTINLTGDVSLLLPQVNSSNLQSGIDMLESYAQGNVAYDTWYANMIGLMQAMGYESAPEGNTITLNCNGAPASNKRFFISVRPGALYGGFTVTVNFTNAPSQEFEIGDISTEGAKYLIYPGRITGVSLELQ